MKRSLEMNNLVDLADDDDVVFSAATDPQAASTAITTKVKTRWLRNGRNEGALMTLNLRELRDEAKRLGFEATYSKVDTKDKYVTYLHKKYSGLEKSGSQTSQTDEDVENQQHHQEEKKKGDERSEEKEEPPKAMETDPAPIEKPSAKASETQAEPQAKKSKTQPSSVSAIREAVAAAVAAVMTSKSGPAAGKKSASKTKSPAAPKPEKVSEEEVKLITKLEEFFGGKRKGKGCLPENDWCCINDIDQLPVISIKDWTVQYPCDEAVCKKLIENCVPVDNKKARDNSAWQLDASEIDILSAPWLSMFGNSHTGSLLEEIRKTLAPKCKKISAKFNKLLVYEKEKGSFFKAPKDRDDRHFATAVVFLPSYFKGGDLTVRHLDKERVCAFSYSNDDLKNEMLKCRSVSFFNDCSHEIKPVESGGYRVALIYNLCYDSNTKEPPTLPPSITEAETKLNSLLKEVFALPSFKRNKKMIGIALQQDYDLPSLTPACLKGDDKVMYDVFMSSGNYDVELTPITVDAQGRCGDDDASEAPKDYYEESIEQGYETKFKIRKRDLKKLLEKEEKRKSRQEASDDEDEDDDDEEEEEEDDDYYGGVVLSDFTWGKRESSSAIKGNVHFVSDWRKVAVGKVCAADATPTHSEGTEFEIQYHANAMLVKPKESNCNK